MAGERLGMICVEDTHGKFHYVEAGFVRRIEELDDGCVVHFGDGGYMRVKEDPEKLALRYDAMVLGVDIPSGPDEGE